MTIVVGVDGSVESRHAVEWALAEARRRSVPLCLLHAWYPSVGGDEATARDLLDAEVDLAHLLEPAVETTGVLVERSSAAEALVDASKDAELVVVGSRTQFAIASLLLGSVASTCVRRCACPVVVVPVTLRELRTAC